jgi:hypothetical protein
MWQCNFLLPEHTELRAQVVSCVFCSAGQRENLNSDMDEEDQEEHR